MKVLGPAKKYSNKVIGSRVYIITFCNDLVTKKKARLFVRIPESVLKIVLTMKKMDLSVRKAPFLVLTPCHVFKGSGS